VARAEAGTEGLDAHGVEVVLEELNFDKTPDIVGRVYFPTNTVGGWEAKGFFLLATSVVSEHDDAVIQPA
jgi:hypothetical protein